MFDYLQLRQEAANRFAIPEEFICPISLEIMREPVVSPSGRSYERMAILNWIAQSGTDPYTNMPLRSDQLYPNLALRDAIELFRKADVSVESLVRKTIFYAISGCSANRELNEPILRGLRHEGYFDIAKDSNLHVQLREQFRNNRLFEQRPDTQERIIRRLAAGLQIHIRVNDDPKVKHGFSLSRISKGRSPFFKEVVDVKHRVHFDLKMDLIPAELRTLVANVVAAVTTQLPLAGARVG